MNPNKLVWIIFILVLFVLPITLILLGVEFNAKYFGTIIGICLVIFFFLIYPRVSKNKEFLAQEEESKEAVKIARQFPDFFKVRVVAGATLFLMLIISVYLYHIKKLRYLEFIAPVLVFGMMMYSASFLRRHKQTAAYGEKLANVEQSGFRTYLKLVTIGTVLYVVWVIILYIFYRYFYK
ncbi:MAG: hypothetical protein HY093_03445 [Candidatus Liptonbacteria bacterium]|nr:hypothetical protein [Candidatus Liptonbacteria bacterium]